MDDVKALMRCGASFDADIVGMGIEYDPADFDGKAVKLPEGIRSAGLATKVRQGTLEVRAHSL